MAFRKETFGTLENGAVITKYTLTNEHGLKAAFTDLGGIWLEMWVPDKHGTLADVVLGYDEPEKYLHQDAHFGEIVGRNANRIGSATCTIDGITYALVINDNGTPRSVKQRMEQRLRFHCSVRTGTRIIQAMRISVSAIL